jgi:hypothetical protein
MTRIYSWVRKMEARVQYVVNKLLLLLSWVIYERYLQFTLFKKLMQAKQSKEKRRNLIFNQEPSILLDICIDLQ